MRSSSPFLTAMLGLTMVLTVNGQTGSAFLQSSPKKTSLSALSLDPTTMLMFEMAIAVLLTAFLVIYFIGSRQNLGLARSLRDTLSKALSDQFVHFGNEDGVTLVKDGQSYYWYYASGRKNTTGMTILFDLAKRMDMFAYTSSFMSNPQRDRIVMFLPIDVPIEPMSMFVVRKKELPRLRNYDEGRPLKETEALAADVIEARGLPDTFAVMTEHPDIVAAVLPQSLRQIITEHSRHVVSIHVTDQSVEWEAQCRMSKKLVRIEFNLPITGESEKIVEDMCHLGLRIVDLAASARLSPAAKKKSLELRKRLQQAEEKRRQKARAEALAAKKLEEKKKEEEAVAKMSREKQIKYEEKKRKKEFNARMRKAAVRK